MHTAPAVHLEGAQRIQDGSTANSRNRQEPLKSRSRAAKADGQRDIIKNRIIKHRIKKQAHNHKTHNHKDNTWTQ